MESHEMASKRAKRKPGPPARYGRRPTLTVKERTPAPYAVWTVAAVLDIEHRMRGCVTEPRSALSAFEQRLLDFQNVVRDLIVNQELFDAMLRPGERPTNAALPQGRSFRCMRGSTFALHQFVSGTAVRFLLMTDPTYSSNEAQRRLAAILDPRFA